MKPLLLIRHGEVPAAWRGRYIGVTDPPLDAAADWAELRRRLEPYRALRVISSPRRRALETARALFDREPEIDARLAEIDFGDWENLTFDEICAVASAEQLRCWRETPDEMTFPNGEAVAAFARRVRAAFAELRSAAAVVTHGGVLMQYLGTLPPRGSLTIRELE